MISGETYVSSVLASIIFANMLVALLVASMFILKGKTNALQIMGLVIAITALTGIAYQRVACKHQRTLAGRYCSDNCRCNTC